MSEHDERPAGDHPDQRGRWRERAAFRVSVDYAADGGGGLVWRTRAYHEESDAYMAWPALQSKCCPKFAFQMCFLPMNEALLSDGTCLYSVPAILSLLSSQDS